MRSNKTIKYFTRFVRLTPDLNGKEKEVVIKRLRSITLESIGKVWGLTEGRIRQIEKRALRKMSGRSQQLYLFRKSKRMFK